MKIDKTTVREKPQTGQVTVGTSALALTSLNSAVKGIKIKAHPANSDNVYVSCHAGVTASNGYVLDAGQELVLEYEDPSKVYIIGGAASQVVSWVVH